MNKVQFLFGVVLMTSVIAGCTQQNPVIENPAHPIATTPPMPEGIFLPEAKVGASYPFDQSPWGNHIVLKVTKKYDSALGKVCVEALISSQNEMQQTKLLCQENQQIWKEYRAL